MEQLLRRYYVFHKVPEASKPVPEEVRWFDAKPTYVLHWINAFEDGDEVVLDGYRQDPSRGAHIKLPDALKPFSMLDLQSVGAHAYRWRFNLKTGATTEGQLSDGISEFGMINQQYAGRPYRYTWEVTAKPGWFLFDGLHRLDVETGARDSYRFPDGVYASESPMAPFAADGEESVGCVVTFTTDMNEDKSECLVFAADDVSAGPIARIRLPQRICSGTHACWAPLDAVR